MKILVTGCFGFIPSCFIKLLRESEPMVEIRAFGRNSAVRNHNRLAGMVDECEYIYGDLNGDISGLLEGVDVVVHFAAKTFVDASIKDPVAFLSSNVAGTVALLEQARKYPLKLFVQISTDEVYGPISEGAHNEEAKLNPTNPYAASKAAADMFVVSYGNTYNIPYIITRCENNYGAFQHPQKVLPTFIKKALLDQSLPVYGDGKHKRMWLRVEDHCSAIWHLIQAYTVKEIRDGIYNIGACQEMENLELAHQVCAILEKPDSLITLIDDGTIRPGHDRRYAIDCTKLRSTGWKPAWDITPGIREAVLWYKQNDWWLK